ncbi:MAG: hypothetical protein V8R16_00760 [Bacilli bacterium]
MKLIKKLIITIITLVVVIIAGAVGTYIYVKNTYDIDLINTVLQLKKISDPVDEKKLITNPYTEEDKTKAHEEVNNSVNGFIGNDGINFDKLLTEMKTVIKLDDKQLACLAQEVIDQEMEGKITIGEQDIPLVLKQIDISNVNNEGNADFNTIVKLDISSFKTNMNNFPLSMLKKYVPDYLYISSTVWVEKNKENEVVVPFAYSTTSTSFTINTLTDKETTELFKTLDAVIKIGTADNLNNQIGNAILGSLIGSEEQNGLAYSLKQYGAKDYRFILENDVDYFVVER